MLKGVNRSIIEVKNLSNPIFEKVICFVRPECCTRGCTDLQTTAENYVRTLIEPDEHQSTKFSLIIRICVPIITAAIGFAVGVLIK